MIKLLSMETDLNMFLFRFNLIKKYKIPRHWHKSLLSFISYNYLILYKMNHINVKNYQNYFSKKKVFGQIGISFLITQYWSHFYSHETFNVRHLYLFLFRTQNAYLWHNAAKHCTVGSEYEVEFSRRLLSYPSPLL